VAVVPMPGEPNQCPHHCPEEAIKKVDGLNRNGQPTRKRSNILIYLASFKPTALIMRAKVAMSLSII